MFYRHGLICDLWFKVMHLSCDSGGQEKAPGELDSLLSTLNTLTAIHFMICLNFSSLTVPNKITPQILFPAYSSKERDKSSPKIFKVEFSTHFILLFLNLGLVLTKVRGKLTQLVPSSAAQEECYLLLISKPGREANWFRGRT